MGGVEVLRRLAEEGEPAVTVRLVNWADEEGARFGRVAVRLQRRGGLDGRPGRAARAPRRRRRGAARRAARSTASTSTARVEARAQLENAAAYLELHIEQGPCSSRSTCRWRRAGHVRRRAPPRHVERPGRRTPARRRWTRGATRSPGRRSCARAAPHRRARGRRGRLHVGRRRLQARHRHFGRRDGEQLLDQRHLDADTLAAMLADARAGSERFAVEESIEVSFDRIWSIEPILFHPELIELCDEAILDVPATRTGCRRARCTTPPRSRAPACRP